MTLERADRCQSSLVLPYRHHSVANSILFTFQTATIGKAESDKAGGVIWVWRRKRKENKSLE